MRQTEPSIDAFRGRRFLDARRDLLPADRRVSAGRARERPAAVLAYCRGRGGGGAPAAVFPLLQSPAPPHSLSGTGREGATYPAVNADLGRRLG